MNRLERFDRPDRPRQEGRPVVSDEEALARMLASETEDPGVRVVLGWIAIQAAARKRRTVASLLTGNTGHYGPQRREDGRILYASTRKPATDKTRELAGMLLRGEVEPSAAVRAHRPGAWVEGRPQGLRDAQLLGLQARFGEGIYGRIAGTAWYLYSEDAPAVTDLGSVPALAPVDGVVA